MSVPQRSDLPLKATDLNLSVSEEVLQIADHRANKLKAALGNPESMVSFEASLAVASRVRKLRRISEQTGIVLKTCKMLEIGSGLGMFLCICCKLGIDCWVLEPSFGSYSGQVAGASNLLSCNGIPGYRIVNASAEQMPFADDEFDLVVSLDVLEHVANPLAVLKESLRVMKPGGYLYCVIPNYLWFWEWHYGIPWLPCLPKCAAKLWVRFFGRNPDFLNELTFVTPWKLKRWLSSINQAHIVQMFESDRDPALTLVTDANNWLKTLRVEEVIELTGAARTGGRPGRLFMGIVARISSLPAIRVLTRKVGMISIIELVVRKSELFHEVD